MFGERVCQMHYDILATAIANYVAGLELAEIAGQDDVLLDWSKARAGEISLQAFQDKWTPYVEPIISLAHHRPRSAIRRVVEIAIAESVTSQDGAVEVGMEDDPRGFLLVDLAVSHDAVDDASDHVHHECAGAADIEPGIFCTDVNMNFV